MLAKWTKLLPFFVVERIARRRCERVTIKELNGIAVYPYKNVYFMVMVE